MKNLTRLDKIEILLGVVAIITGLISVLIGTSIDNSSYYSARSEVQISLESGYDGGALGFAIISACCIVMITWIEITRFKINK